MEVLHFDYPCTHFVIKNFYAPSEVKSILDELNFLGPHMKPPQETGSAQNQLGTNTKSNSGVWLQDFYKGREDQSPILKLNKKVFDQKLKFELQDKSWFTRYLDRVKDHSVLVSYYKDGDYYETHQDQSWFTAIYYVWAEPKSFEGGNIFLENSKTPVPIENNSLLIFPSVANHTVEKVKGSGRFAITSFMNVTDREPPMDKLPLDRFFNFLSVMDFNRVHDELYDSKRWSLAGSSRNGKEALSRFWYHELSDNDFYSKYLFNKIANDIVKMPCELQRVYANGQTFGQDGEFHQDHESDDVVTFMIYISKIHDRDVEMWGGQTEFRWKDRIISIEPVTNSAVFFKANVWHRGKAPSRYIKEMRVTIAWKIQLKRN